MFLERPNGQFWVYPIECTEQRSAELHSTFETTRSHNPFSGRVREIFCSWRYKSEFEPAKSNFSVLRIIKLINVCQGVDVRSW